MTFEELKEECLKDPEVAKEYKKLQPEMAIIRKIIEARNIIFKGN